MAACQSVPCREYCEGSAEPRVRLNSGTARFDILSQLFQKLLIQQGRQFGYRRILYRLHSDPLFAGPALEEREESGHVC